MAVSQDKQRSDARLDFRLNQQVKEVIEQAAAVSGQSVSDFAVSVLYRTAKEVLENERNTRLSDRDRDIFLALLDSDAKPNEALKRAANRYKKAKGAR
ncbi:MAG TPA: DUF1778 domain-containing protein [Blastocatellia bacterium]|nr:DUF1778 domain-containing protein [Blastocatellia bacterium]